MNYSTLNIQGADASLYTQIYPKPNAETIILLHGGPGVPTDFSALAQVLGLKYQVIYFEQRGTGRSPNPSQRYSIEDYLADIDAIAEHFSLNHFHLLGHSWGGLYAQIYAHKHPEKILSLFLISPASGTANTFKQTEREVMRYNKAHCTSGQWMLMGIFSLAGMLGLSWAYQALFKQVIRNYMSDFDPAFSVSNEMVSNVRAAPINKTRKAIIHYPELSQQFNPDFPVLIIYGENDIYGDSTKSVKTRYPKAQTHLIKNAGHFSWENNPDKFFRYLKDFFNIPYATA